MTRKYTVGTNIADITINGTTTKLYVPSNSGSGSGGSEGGSSGGQGGSTVSINRKLSSGTNIADITIDGVTTKLYAPNGGSGEGGGSAAGGSTVEYTATVNSGTKLGELSIDGAVNNIYAPAVTVTQSLSSGTKIGTVTVGGVATNLYAPTPSGEGGGGGSSEGGSGYVMPTLKNTVTLSEAVNIISFNQRADENFYIEGMVNQNGTSNGNFSLYGIDENSNEHLMVAALSFSTNSDTYFAIYGHQAADGRWVCWARTGNSPQSGPTGTGTSIGSASTHALGWTNNTLQTIRGLKLSGTKAFGRNTEVRVFTDVTISD